MRTFLAVSVLCVAGCVTPTDKPAAPDNDAILSAVLEQMADVVERDGALETPRLLNTSHVNQCMSLALRYRVGTEDVTPPGWLTGYDSRYAAQFEPAGEAVPLDAGKRAGVAAFLRNEAGALRGE